MLCNSSSVILCAWLFCFFLLESLSPKFWHDASLFRWSGHRDWIFFCCSELWKCRSAASLYLKSSVMRDTAFSSAYVGKGVWSFRKPRILRKKNCASRQRVIARKAVTVAFTRESAPISHESSHMNSNQKAICVCMNNRNCHACPNSPLHVHRTCMRICISPVHGHARCTCFHAWTPCVLACTRARTIKFKF